LLIAAVVIGGFIGWNKLSEWSDHNSAKGLAAGECLSSLPYISNATPSRVSCSSSAAQYRVISNNTASSFTDSNSVAALCERQGYNALPPSRDAWDSGDHTVLCYSYM
jgi:hypothetical protein